ncbi:MAG: EamA family transporter RarD [Deferrisomatales bacterium]|nr:EamA family transporter RarD [Deferrisomatales bacterium]
MNDIPAVRSGHSRGVAFGLSAYLIWGFFPLFFRTLRGVPPAEVLAHRILWAALLLLGLVLATGSSRQLRAAVSTPRSLAALCCSTALICTNWFVFLHAVDSGQVLQSSLGYFITPLVSVLLGGLVLGERLRRLQTASVGLAVLGVAVQAWLVGEVPAISLVLAGSFGTYGLVRKLAGVRAVIGLTVETSLLSPFALAFMLTLWRSGESSFLVGNPSIDWLLLAAGAVTAAPLILFGVAMLRLRLGTLGLLQYLVPTLHFLTAVFAFGEPFTGAHLVSFGCIWTGLAIYTWDGLRGVPERGAQGRAR